jgi:hypothetical protein
MEKKTRLLTVSEAANGYPRILLNGAWLDDWGFTIGDRVAVTKTDTNEIVIKLDTPALKWMEMRRKRELQNQLIAAEDELNYHRSKHPTLYDQPADPGQILSVGNKPGRMTG